MKVIMQNEKIAVSKIGRDSGSKDSLLSMPDSHDTVGHICHLYENYTGELKIGQKIVFGDARDRVILNGKEFEIMSPENVHMILGDDLDTKKDIQNASKK